MPHKRKPDPLIKVCTSKALPRHRVIWQRQSQGRPR